MRFQSSTLFVWYRSLVGLVTALILVQAALAGRFLFIDPGTVDAHEIIGNLLVVLVAFQLLMAYLLRSAIGFPMAVLNAVLATLVVAQVGLGYSGRDNADMASAHVPIGVLTFGVSMLIAGWAFQYPVPRSH